MKSGFTDIAGLSAGGSQVLSIGFDPVTAGLFEQVVGISLYGTNASGYRGDLPNFAVTLRGRVLPASPVPLPAPIWLLGVPGFALLRQRRSVRASRS